MKMKAFIVRHGKASVFVTAAFLFGALSGVLATGGAGLRTSRLVPGMADRFRGGPQGLASLQDRFAPVAKKVMPAMVGVSATRAAASQPDRGITSTIASPGSRLRMGNAVLAAGIERSVAGLQESSGPGVIAGPNGPILTSSRLIAGASGIMVTLSDCRVLPARVLGMDPATDIAVLTVDAEDLPYVKFGDSSEVAVGDPAVAFGNPLQAGASYSVGSISATGRPDGWSAGSIDYIQTLNAVGPGKYGGALVNESGRLVGLSTIPTLSAETLSEGIGYAVPANLVRTVMDEIVTNGRVTRSWFGAPLGPVVTTSGRRASPFEKSQGALVGEVAPESPAARGGLSKGDLIVEFNGFPVTDSRELYRRISMIPQGATVQLRVFHGGNERSISVTLTAPPAPGTNERYTI